MKTVGRSILKEGTVQRDLENVSLWSGLRGSKPIAALLSDASLGPRLFVFQLLHSYHLGKIA